MKFHRQAAIVAAIDLESLKDFGIQGIILDVDNTIVSEDDLYLSPGAEAWVEQAKLAGFKFFILSNGKRRHRLKSWAHRLDMPAINPAKKPFPAGFRKAFAHMQLKPQQVVIIGDSLHTDVLGAWLAGCSSIQVASLPHPARWWEKLLGHWLHFAYPTKCELWPNDHTF